VARDPVCSMEVDEEKAPAKTDYKAQTYYFCAPGCRVAFEKDPEKYLRMEAAEDQGPLGPP
jgi:YHS domain-containing protein